MNPADSPLALTAPPPAQIIPASQLLKDFKPCESIIDGLPVPRGALVSITAPTGHGKTTVSALLQVALCRGLPFAGREVTMGSVLVLAGENPDDYTVHLAATLKDVGLVDGYDLCRPKPMGCLSVIPGTFALNFEMDYLSDNMAAYGTELVAVFVDTSAAFYSADDENDNVSMRRHASMLRELTTLPGRPTVFVLCHPTKNAQRDNLLPRGGGAFLAEVDANLTLWKDEAGIVSLHWAGKIRGPTFDPIRFEMGLVELPYKDCRGRPVTSVAARHVADDRAEQLIAKAVADEDVLLIAMQRKPNGSVRDLAMQCGWVGSTCKPLTSRVDRTLKTLETAGLVTQDRRRRWHLTTKGQKDADSL